MSEDRKGGAEYRAVWLVIHFERRLRSALAYVCAIYGRRHYLTKRQQRQDRNAQTAFYCEAISVSFFSFFRSPGVKKTVK